MAEADYRLMTEATGQRIAAALEALHLATVTGVKGNSEANYRHGDVILTSANIGAVAKSGDTMTGFLSLRDGGNGSTATSGGHLEFMRGTDGKKMAFVCTNDNTVYFEILRDPGNENGGREGYKLPTPTQTSGWADYSILTTKDGRTKLGLVPTSVNVTANATYTQSATGTGISVVRYGNVVNVNANIKLSGTIPQDYGWYTVYSGLPTPAFAGYCNGILRFDTAPGMPAMVLINSSGDLQVSPRGANIQNLQGLLFATYICAN